MPETNQDRSCEDDRKSSSQHLVPVVHKTNLVPLSPDERKPPHPTAQAYGEFQAAFDFFNNRLFDGSLPRCLITLPHHSPLVGGYFCPSRFASNSIPGATTDEIALNPIHFKGWDATEVLQTLVHEMCHLWQAHFGKPSRRGYHNKEWAAKMEAIGLQPVSFDEPGKTTGQRIGDFVIAGGPFDVAVQELLSNRFRISWYDRLADLLQQMAHGPAVSTAGTADVTSGHAGRRCKFTCGGCGANAWGKASLNLVCGDCERGMSRS